MSTPQGTLSVEALLACALAIEQDAAERYTELAHQMEVHNNPEVAELFHKLAAIEAKHVANVEAASESRTLPSVNPLAPPWQGSDGPEAVAYDEVHYLMTPHHAISLALAGERSAAGYFAGIAEAAQDAEVRRLAARLRDEEREHVTLLEEWLRRHPAPEQGWDEDLDPAAMPE